MKKALRLILLLTVLPVNSSLAGDITGIWQGKLVTGPGAELTVQFIIEKAADGTHTAVLNSPDQGALKNIPANSVNFDGKILKIEVSAVEGSFEGNMKDNVIDGKWMQSGMSFPLSLSPYTHPTLSRGSVDKILGTWHGDYEVPPPVGLLLVKFRFEISKDQTLIGFLDVPEQGAYGVKTGNITLKGDDLTVLMNPAGSYNGKLDGDEISGKFTGPGGQSLPLVLKRGDKLFLKSLGLSQNAQDQLSGTWHGALTTPQTTLTIVFRFEKTKEGSFIGFLDSPNQGLSGAVISDTSLEQQNLAIKLNALNILYNGQISGDSITGKFTQGGRSMDLNLKKGSVPAIKLKLSESSFAQIMGKWQGMLNTSQGSYMVALRFEKTENGEIVGFYDNIDMSRLGIPVDEATLQTSDLTLKINSIRSEYKGKLSGNTLTGQFISSGRSADAVLERKQ